jgi:C-terminal processing protease CtpA/Prc
MKALGVRHTSLFTRDEWKAQMTGEQQGNTKPIALTSPAFRLLPDRIGYVHIYAFIGTAKAVQEYEDHFHAGMTRLRQQGACRYIVDLRGNDGGNMWPMLNGVVSLLGAPPFGFFEPGSDPGEVWTIKHGEVQSVDTDIRRVPAYSQERSDPPVAVLVDRETSSSGEFTAMAFEGRGGTRIFGQPRQASSPATISSRCRTGPRWR